MAPYILNAAAGLVASCLVAYVSSPPQQVDDSDRRTKESLVLSSFTRVTALTSTIGFVGPQLAQLALAYLQSRPCAPSRDLGLLDASEWVGIALQAAGALLRIWCFRVLGRYFTFEVTIRKEHKLIRAPPYSHVRHPAYTGTALLAAGTLIRLNGSHSALVQLGYLPERDRSPLTALVLAALFIAAFGERIRGEEAALAKAFPEEWPGYVRETWRLVPGLF